MSADYKISLATAEDIPGILALEDANLPGKGGNLSVRHNADWFRRAILEKSVVACRRDGAVVGYVLGTSLALKAEISIIQAMVRAFPPKQGCYLYGPVCVAETERGKGVADAMFKELRTHMPSRSAMTFVRADNAMSCRAHAKMGMQELGTFTSDAELYVALSYEG